MGRLVNTVVNPEEQYRENHQMVFEACKHLTTLDTAAALVLAAVFRELEIGIAGAAWPLGFFGGSLLVCATGMIVTALSGLGSRKAVLLATVLLVLGASVLFLGLVVAVVTVLSS